MGLVDNLVHEHLDKTRQNLCDLLNSNVIFYYGPMFFDTPRIFYEFISKMTKKKKALSIILTTSGGAVEPTERTVEIIRTHFGQVNFIVPDYAMSAGTVFCMSGDKIFMDEVSSLGPIDPQLQQPDGTLVPALGYLEQLEKIIERSKSGEISMAEIDMLRQLDLGDINRFEQARNLTITLLKKWLVNYKFKDWKVHRSSPKLKGKPVTQKQKEERAEDIARQLGDVKIWHSHGRHISAKTLESVLRLEIDNYSNIKNLKDEIAVYQGIAIDYIRKNGYMLFAHGENSLSVISGR